MLSPETDSSKLSILVLGGSGFVGSEFIKVAQESNHIRSIIVLLRRSVEYLNAFNKVKVIVDEDSSNWGRIIEELDPGPDVVFSALGATKGTAGTQQEQRKVDYNLNLSIAKAAKMSGPKVFMVVTSFNNSLLSTVFPYFRMKQEVEDAIEEQLFDKVILLRPGPIVGDRSDVNKDQPITVVLTSWIAQKTYRTFLGVFLGIPVKAQEIAQTSVYLIETHSELPSKRIVTSEEILSLSSTLNVL